MGSTRITAVDAFALKLPAPELDGHPLGEFVRSYTVIRVDTDAGVRGWNFYPRGDPQALAAAVRPILVGEDLFAVERHLKAGLLAHGAVEMALWDAIGKLAGQPVYRLLGGERTSLKAYLTVVWPGDANQSEASYAEQAAMAVRIKEAGFKGMKIRCWRSNPADDADAYGEIRAAVGPDFAIMVDRTAGYCGHVWSYQEALDAARRFERHGVLWLEEPFDRDDFEGAARLAREVDIAITGGEPFRGLPPFQESIRHGSFDILQPDAVLAGGILTTKKVAALAEAHGVRCFLHGNGGLALAGWLQAAAAIGAEWQELVYIIPPFLPEQQWSFATQLLKGDTLYRFQDGEIVVPDGPGLGLDLDEEALEELQARAEREAGSS